METKNCIYCGRAVALHQLHERSGSFRCRDENDCLAFQSRDDAADSAEEGEYLQALVKAARGDAAGRIAALERAAAAEGGSRDDEGEGFAWIRAALDALEAEFGDEGRVRFQGDPTGKPGCRILLGGEEGRPGVCVGIGLVAGRRYSLAVATREHADAGGDPFAEFVYKTYPPGRKEALIGDLSVLLVAAGAKEGVSAQLLRAFRDELEARCCGDEES